jgi:Cd2+/Zn2+-exporting ATPase
MQFFRNSRAVLTAICGVALVAGLTNPLPWVIVVGLVCGSFFALRATWRSIRSREVDVNLLMVLAAVGAIVIGRPLDALGLMFLFSLSGTLEDFALGRTRSAIEGLIKLRPDTAIRVAEGGDQRVRVEELRPGDRVRIPPHSAVPCDGRIIEGRSSLDQSAMTGESVLVDKGPGDELLAGTLNQDGALLVNVTAGIEDSTLTKIVSLVEDAQANKASGERISTWFGSHYTWYVLMISVVSLAVRRVVGQPADVAVYGSLVLLVALSPCALVISTPAATLSALAYAARRGMLVRGGKFIELAGQTKAVLMDKTGTLTAGTPALVDICICLQCPVGGQANGEGHASCWHGGPEMSEIARTLLGAAAALEQYSTHPIAESIMRTARQYGVPVSIPSDLRAAPGLGIVAQVGGKRTLVGQQRFFEQEGVPAPGAFLRHASELTAEGMTTVLMVHGDTFAAMALRDLPRERASETVAALRGLGVNRIVMATGDNPATAAAIAAEVGIEEVRAGLLPQQKEEQIETLTAECGVTMMVGDGINDAPSLARASVGVAMGGLGSDIALNAADVVLMNDNLDRIPEFIRLGRRTNRIIRANLIFATGMIACLALVSIFAVLPLPIAVLGHEGSTVVVILNGLRLLAGPRRV